MRIPLVPAGTLLLGLVLFAVPLFVPVSLDAAALAMEGLDVETALHAASIALYLAALFITAAGLALLGRHHVRPGDPPPTRLVNRITTALAAVAIAAALFFATVLAILTASMDITATLHAAGTWVWLAGVAVLFAGLILVSRHLARRQRVEAGRQKPQTTVAALLAFTLLATTMAMSPAAAQSLGDMATAAAADLEQLPFLISVAFYVLGILFVCFGLLRLKRQADHPGQTTIASGIIAMAIGAALIAAPFVINAIGTTFDVDPAATLSRPALDP